MHPDAVDRRLSSLPELSRQGKRINGLHRLLTCPRIWERAYEMIAQNTGALTPGTDPDNTLDGFSLARMERIIAQVRDGTYRFAPVRRKYIPKPNGKLRPLGIPNADDKLVQAAVKLVLEQVYEPIFSANSHGFRAGRSCHTALEEVRKVWTGVVWLVDVDVVGFFDNIDHDILLGLLKQRIDDDDFIRLIKGMLVAGHMEDWTWHATYSGTPQGGVISPLLANVYLHELDQFMSAYQTQFNKGLKRHPDPNYAQVVKRINTCRAAIRRRRSRQRGEDVTPFIDEIRGLQKQLMQHPSLDQFDPDYRRLLYVRYADDFMVGVIGSKRDARNVMSDVRAFLKGRLRLDASEEKSGISAATEGTSFLSYTVKAVTTDRIQRIERKDSSRPMLRRDPSRTVQLHVPEHKLAAFVERKRLGNYHTRRGEPRNWTIHSSDLEILTSYNVTMRGLAEYYKLGTLWKRQLSRVHYVWWYSLLKTLGRKHKCSVPAVLNEILDYHNGERGLWYDTKDGRKFRPLFTLKHVRRREPSARNMDRFASTAYLDLSRTDLMDRLMAQQCESCGATDAPMEIHHARRMADVSHQSLMARIKAARRRKRIVLCRSCHTALHAGELQARLHQVKAGVGAG